MATLEIDQLLYSFQQGDTDASAQARAFAMENFVAALPAHAELADELDQLLLQQSPAVAANLAFFIGTLLEKDLLPSPSQAVPTLFCDWLQQLPQDETSEDEWYFGSPTSFELADLSDQQRAILAALPLLCQAMLSHLVKMPELLEELRRDHEFLEQLDFIKPHCAQVFWIREFVLCCSGRLLVLHPTSQSGVWVQYQNVGTCFQLFSLLQLAIGEGIQGGAPSNPEVAAVFNGQSQQVLRDQAWWHYEEVNMYSQSGFYKLWGGGKVRFISKFDEQQILVLSPPILPTLTWEIPSPFPIKIPATVVIERYLEPEECQAWLRKLAQLREEREDREIQARSQVTTKPNSLSRDLLPYGIPIFFILLGLVSHIPFRNHTPEIDNPPLPEQASQSQQKSATLAPGQELWQVEDFVLLEKIPTYGGYPKYFHLKLFASGKVEMRGDAKLCISAPVVYAEVDAAKVKHIMQTLQGLQFYSLPNYSAVEKEDTADLSITFQQSNRQHRIAINRKALNFPSMIGQLEQEIERVVEAPKLLEKISASEKVCFTNK